MRSVLHRFEKEQMELTSAASLIQSSEHLVAISAGRFISSNVRSTEIDFRGTTSTEKGAV